MLSMSVWILHYNACDVGMIFTEFGMNFRATEGTTTQKFLIPVIKIATWRTRFGGCPASVTLKKNIWETGCSLLRWGCGRHLICHLFLGDPTEEVPPTPSLEDGNRSSFRNIVFFGIPDAGQSPRSQQSRVLYTITQPFRIYCIVSITDSIVKQIRNEVVNSRRTDETTSTMRWWHYVPLS
jgi:hypothetical protein